MRWFTIAIILCGCASSPPSQFYTLSPTAGRDMAAVASPDYRILVGPVSVPESVDRPQLVVRLSENRVTLVEQARWAEPLSSAIPGVIAENLRRLLNSSGVMAYPQGPENFDCEVRLEVLRFDSAPNDAATLDVAWTLRWSNGAAPQFGRTRVRERVDGPGTEALVAAHSRALQAVSSEIALAIRQRGNALSAQAMR